ncbi:MAG: GTPase Era [Actinobacteria bacterium]|nr:MAG: GTPase Era [Actinomycetota bacterium]
MPPDRFRSGFVALIGRPNVGKSTLLNRLVGTKVAIVSEKPQTTRHQIRGVLTLPHAQVVFVDTPGLHKPRDFLGEQLNVNVKRALADVDAVVFLVDSWAGIGRGDEFVASEILRSGKPAILVLNKIDRLAGSALEEQLAKAAELGPFRRVLPVSATKGENLGELLQTVIELLPEGPKYYPDEDTSDQPLEVLVAELVREKVLQLTHEEVPHSVGVEVDRIEKRRGRSLYDVEVSIVVERPSQKGIVIGKGGALLKEAGRLAREEIQALLGGQVYLDLKVKVRKGWRKDERSLRRFGYLSE